MDGSACRSSVREKLRAQSIQLGFLFLDEFIAVPELLGKMIHNVGQLGDPGVGLLHSKLLLADRLGEDFQLLLEQGILLFQLPAAEL